MLSVKRKILILSGKGGVGKSTFTAQLGWAFAADEDVQVCILAVLRWFPNLLAYLSDRNYGCGHLRAIHTDYLGDCFRASTFFFVRMVACLCAR